MHKARTPVHSLVRFQRSRASRHHAQTMMMSMLGSSGAMPSLQHNDNNKNNCKEMTARYFSTRNTMTNGWFGWGSNSNGTTAEVETTATSSTSSPPSSTPEMTTTNTIPTPNPPATDAVGGAPTVDNSHSGSGNVNASGAETPSAGEWTTTNSSSSSRLQYDDGKTGNTVENEPTMDEDLDYTELAEDALNSASDAFSGFWEHFNISRHIQDFICTIHDTTGLPWWLSIVALAGVLRMVTFPLTVMSTQTSVRMMNHKERLAVLTRKITSAQTAEERIRANSEAKEFKKKHGISQGMMALPIIQAPVFISFFMALRSMAANNPAMETAGIWWFTDLSIPDPYGLLPALSCALMVLSFEMGQKLGSSTSAGMNSGMRSVITWGIRSFGVIGFFFFKNMPAILFLYWMPSSIIQMVQHVLLRVNPFKKWFNIPEPIELSTKDRIAKTRNPSSMERLLPSFLSKKIADNRKNALFKDEQGNPLQLYTQNELAKKKPTHEKIRKAHSSYERKRE